MVTAKYGYLCYKYGGKEVGYKNTWLVKNDTNKYISCSIPLQIRLPKEYIGKRVRFKVEIVEETSLQSSNSEKRSK